MSATQQLMIVSHLFKLFSFLPEFSYLWHIWLCIWAGWCCQTPTSPPSSCKYLCSYRSYLWQLNRHSFTLETSPPRKFLNVICQNRSAKEAQKLCLKNNRLSFSCKLANSCKSVMLAWVNIVEHAEYWGNDDVIWLSKVCHDQGDALAELVFLHIVGMLPYLAWTLSCSRIPRLFISWWKWQKEARDYFHSQELGSTELRLNGDHGNKRKGQILEKL